MTFDLRTQSRIMWFSLLEMTQASLMSQSYLVLRTKVPIKQMFDVTKLKVSQRMILNKFSYLMGWRSFRWTLNFPSSEKKGGRGGNFLGFLQGLSKKFPLLKKKKRGLICYDKIRVLEKIEDRTRSKCLFSCCSSSFDFTTHIFTETISNITCDYIKSFLCMYQIVYGNNRICIVKCIMVYHICVIQIEFFIED